MTANSNNNSNSSGALENKTMPTIGQSITPQAHHINMRKEFITPLIVLEMLNMKQQQQQQQQQTTAKAA
jgi:hypothetical protein